jgi:hypothetical protein
MIRFVARKVFLGVRINTELKKTLEEIAGVEERSVSQFCELLLKRGIISYKKEGTKYLQMSAPREKKEKSPEQSD